MILNFLTCRTDSYSPWETSVRTECHAWHEHHSHPICLLRPCHPLRSRPQLASRQSRKGISAFWVECFGALLWSLPPVTRFAVPNLLLPILRRHVQGRRGGFNRTGEEGGKGVCGLRNDVRAEDEKERDLILGPPIRSLKTDRITPSGSLRSLYFLPLQHLARCPGSLCLMIASH